MRKYFDQLFSFSQFVTSHLGQFEELLRKFLECRFRVGHSCNRINRLESMIAHRLPIHHITSVCVCRVKKPRRVAAHILLGLTKAIPVVKLVNVLEDMSPCTSNLRNDFDLVWIFPKINNKFKKLVIPFVPLFS